MNYIALLSRLLLYFFRQYISLLAHNVSQFTIVAVKGSGRNYDANVTSLQYNENLI